MRKNQQQHPAKSGMRSTLIGIFISFILATVKGIAGVTGNSYALIADAVESVADVFTSFIVWIGLKVSSIDADENHPYGHGKAEPLAAILVAIAIMGASVFIAVQSIYHIRTPHQLPETYTLYILVLVIIVKELLFRYVIKVGNLTESTVVVADAWHHRSDALTSAAAFIGILIALIGGEGYESADDWAALFASAIIMYNGFRIFKPAFLEIMDTAPPASISHNVKKTAKKVPGVQGLDKCYVRKMGFEYYVDLHIIVDAYITVYEGHEIAHKVKDAIREADPRIKDVLIHVEPGETKQ